MFDFVAIHIRRNRKSLGIFYHLNEPDTKDQGTLSALTIYSQLYFPFNPEGVTGCLAKARDLSYTLDTQLGICPVVRDRFPDAFQYSSACLEKSFAYVRVGELFGEHSRRMSDGHAVGRTIEESIGIEQRVVVDFHNCKPGHNFFVTALAPFNRAEEELGLKHLLYLHHLRIPLTDHVERALAQNRAYYDSEKDRAEILLENPELEMYLG